MFSFPIKATNKLKVGRFGIGFNSIYHVTDFPGKQSLFNFTHHVTDFPGKQSLFNFIYLVRLPR